jgi:hypothetical protein
MAAFSINAVDPSGSVTAVSISRSWTSICMAQNTEEVKYRKERLTMRMGEKYEFEEDEGV